MTKYLFLLALILGFAKSALGAEINEISIEVETPTPCYSMLISEVYTGNQNALVVAQILPPSADMSCMSSIGRISAQVNITTKLPPKVEYVVLGKTWCWDSSSGKPTGYIYPRSVQELDSLKSGLTQAFSQSIPRSLLPSPEQQWNDCPTNK